MNVSPKHFVLFRTVSEERGTSSRLMFLYMYMNWGYSPIRTVPLHVQGYLTDKKAHPPGRPMPRVLVG